MILVSRGEFEDRSLGDGAMGTPGSSVPRQNTETTNAKTAAPYRPVQYLGNKLRVLDDIADAAAKLIGQEGSVVDLFTGTSVVAQTFAHRGYSVTAVDTQSYARTFAVATLGIGRSESDKCPADELLEEAAGIFGEPSFASWAAIAERERSILDSGDMSALRQLYAGLPLAWKNSSHPHHSLVLNGDDESAAERLPLITNVHAGSYFGVEQALKIDALRYVIERRRRNGSLLAGC